MLVSKLIPPSPETFKVAIHGMRNAFASWDKGDSKICDTDDYEPGICNEFCPMLQRSQLWAEPICMNDSYNYDQPFNLGQNDKRLLFNLCKEGDPSHRKVLRQLPVIMDIRLPLFIWKQLDQYKVGTVTNSESTMHCLTKEPFKTEDFYLKSVEDISLEEINDPEYLLDLFGDATCPLVELFDKQIVSLVNILRAKYLETGDMRYWHAINEVLPQSYLQTRTWSANYEVLVTIIKNRVSHKLPLWRELIIEWLKRLPYLLDICLACGILKRVGQEINYYDEKSGWKFLFKIHYDEFN